MSFEANSRRSLWADFSSFAIVRLSCRPLGLIAKMLFIFIGHTALVVEMESSIGMTGHFGAQKEINGLM